jgi:hypothetical protein
MIEDKQTAAALDKIASRMRDVVDELAFDERRQCCYPSAPLVERLPTVSKRLQVAIIEAEQNYAEDRGLIFSASARKTTSAASYSRLADSRSGVPSFVPSRLI